MSLNISEVHEKQNEFLTKLNVILGKQDSSIAVAFLHSPTPESTILCFASDFIIKDRFRIHLDLCYNYFETFDFHTSFSKKIEYLVQRGFSEFDSQALVDLFNEYTFRKKVDAQSFASNFLYDGDQLIKDKFVYLKFKADEDLNTFIIDSKNLYKGYGCTKRDNFNSHLLPILPNETLQEMVGPLVPNHNDKSFILDNLKDHDTYVVFELYADYSTGKRYVGKVITPDAN
jgi:hypothetical protein